MCFPRSIFDVYVCICKPFVHVQPPVSSFLAHAHHNAAALRVVPFSTSTVCTCCRDKRRRLQALFHIR